MSTTRDIAVLVGSLRRESLNRKTAKALMEVAPDASKREIVEIGGLPLYNDDREGAQVPGEWYAAWVETILAKRAES
jgi:chromate reductase, NAD(P)H dehydrogenase (quinone)